MEGGEEDGDPKNISINLLHVADTGNAAFLDELLKARLDPDIGDSKGRTPLVSFNLSVQSTCTSQNVHELAIKIVSIAYLSSIGP